MLISLLRGVPEPLGFPLATRLYTVKAKSSQTQTVSLAFTAKSLMMISVSEYIDILNPVLSFVLHKRLGLIRSIDFAPKKDGLGNNTSVIHCTAGHDPVFEISQHVYNCISKYFVRSLSGLCDCSKT